MLFKSIFNFMFASPVTIAASVVSFACIALLVINISPFSSDNKASDDLKNGYNNEIKANDLRVTDIINGQSEENRSAEDNKNSFKKSSGITKKSVRSKSDADEQVDGVEYLPIGPVVEEKSPSIDNDGPSIFDYSAPNYSTNTTNTTSTTISTDSSSPAATPDNTNPNDNISENNFPPELINDVIIDPDETHSISCRPIVANGPPCMCTYTVVDLDGTRSRVEDNCG